jgi:uncharacterized sodium:solute symporter family permease YidK
VLPILGKAKMSESIGMNGFDFLAVVFWLLVIFMAVIAKVAPRKEAWEIETKNTIDMTPWKGAPVVSVVLVLVVFGIYAYFI